MGKKRIIPYDGLAITKLVNCESCNGSGKPSPSYKILGFAQPTKCPSCKGRGKQEYFKIMWKARL